MHPFTTSALDSPCLVRASFANKQNSTAEGWGLGAQCVCVEPELPPYVHKQNPRQHTFSFASAAQNNIPIFLKKTDQHHVSPSLPSRRACV
jgi:hypothetical protein